MRETREQVILIESFSCTRLVVSVIFSGNFLVLCLLVCLQKYFLKHVEIEIYIWMHLGKQ